MMHLVESLLEALHARDRERLLACSREATAALRNPRPTTLEKELAELLSSIAGELVSISDARRAEDSSSNQLSLCHDLLSHARTMAQQEA
jgi:hypothetical protein